MRVVQVAAVAQAAALDGRGDGAPGCAGAGRGAREGPGPLAHRHSAAQLLEGADVMPRPFWQRCLAWGMTLSSTVPTIPA